MYRKLFTGLVATTAATTCYFAASPAHALTLRPDLWETFNSMVNEERSYLEDSELTPLDPNSLYWNGVDPVDVFFINEGAGYRNQLYYTVNDGSETLIFEDVSSPDSILPNSDGALELGEGTSLGTFDGPTQISFEIQANGYNNPNGLFYGPDAASNPDGLEHVIAFEYYDEVEDQTYVLLGFEDLYGTEANGSDRDFNDVVFVVRGIQEGAPTSEVPEPSMILGTLLLAGGTLALGRSRSVAS